MEQDGIVQPLLTINIVPLDKYNISITIPMYWKPDNGVSIMLHDASLSVNIKTLLNPPLQPYTSKYCNSQRKLHTPRTNFFLFSHFIQV